MDNNTQQNDQGSASIAFMEFLAGYDFVKIPRIQRDYVQGGKDDKAKDIRKGFLADLKDAVTGKKELLLDFVYGVKEDNTFLPLDGQQRLTTLFLLYWYGARQLEDKSLCKKILEQLKKFSYQTRFSSKDFCSLLFDESLIGNTVLVGDSTESAGDDTAFGADNIEKLITDNPHFSRFWRYDPTVDSMLNMLRDIDDKFKNEVTAEQWATFFGNENVKFFKYDIEDSQKSDELYVKMNARGKHLTYFENLKARLQQWMPVGYDKTRWKSAIDSKWSDFFWKTSRAANEKYTDKDPAPTLIDRPFWIFLNRMSLFAYLQKKENEDFLIDLSEKKQKDCFKDKGNCFDEMSQRKQVPMKTAYVSSQYHREIFKSDGSGENVYAYRLISNTLNVVCSFENDLSKMLLPRWKQGADKKSIARFFWGGGDDNKDYTYGELLMLWAFGGYCEKFGDDIPADAEKRNIWSDNCSKWMQFCWQVTYTPDFRDTANGVRLLVKCLGCMSDNRQPDIHRFLSQKYEAWMKDDKSACDPIAKWHYDRRASQRYIYNKFFGQEIPPTSFSSGNDNNQAGKNSGDKKLLLFRASDILDEAFKAYLRGLSGDWGEVLDKLEKDNRLCGCIQGIISREDSDGDLLSNVKNRINNYTPNRFSGTQMKDDFSLLFGNLVLSKNEEISINFDFHSEKWRQNVVGRGPVAEAVCKVLNGVRDNGAATRPDWLTMLVDNSAALIEWGSQVRMYADDKVYVFQKAYINGGAIVLDQKVHDGLRSLEEASIFTPNEKDGYFYICDECYERSGCFGKKLSSDGKRRIVFLCSGLRREEKVDDGWKFQEQLLAWSDGNLRDEIDNFLNTPPEEQQPGVDSDNHV